MRKRFFHYLGLFIFALLAVIALGATLIPMIPSKQWYIRIFDYPRLQSFGIAILALAWYAFFYFKRGRTGFIFVLMFLVVIVVQGYKAWPYTILGTKQVLQADENTNGSGKLSLLICNVLQTNTHYDEVLAKVNKHRPDIFITTESDIVWQQALEPLHKDYPYRVQVPLSNTYGMHLYSRLPLSDTSVRYLLEPDIPSIRSKVKLRSGEEILLLVVHPRPPVPGEASDSKERDAEIILVGKEARKEKGGVIVTGDFNDVAWSETTELFQEVTGYLDPRRGRNFYNTYHANVPFFRWPLDHIFHSPHFKLVRMNRLGRVNSDHFPMFIELAYVPAEKSDQPEVAPDAKTETDANKNIQQGKSDKDAPGQ